MICGTPADKVITIEGQNWDFTTEINSVLMQEPLFYVDSTYVDAHTYRAILIKRDVENKEAK